MSKLVRLGSLIRRFHTCEEGHFSKLLVRGAPSVPFQLSVPDAFVSCYDHARMHFPTQSCFKDDFLESALLILNSALEPKTEMTF